MKRRAFCVSAAVFGAAALPLTRVLAGTSAAITEVPAVTGDGRRILLARSDVDDFRASLRGQLLLSDDAGYESARKVWNGMIDRRPALIARCTGAADVVQSVNFARAHSLLTAVRGGGHSLSGHSVCDGGLMIDLSAMRSVQVDPDRRIARVEAGVLLGELDRESLAFGLVTTTGTVSHTGAAGLTLGGGFGRLARKLQLACDNVEAVSIVTAAGQLLRADARTNADLYWAVRGGGGNFGVVTSFEYRLHPFDPMVYGGFLVYPFAHARELIRFYDGFASEAPDEFWGVLEVTGMAGGARALVLEICYCGPHAAATRVVEPLRRFRTPLRDTLGPVPYRQLQTSHDERARHGRHYYTKSGFVKRLDPALIDRIVGTIESTPLRAARIAINQKGGAMAHVAADATAFWYRGAAHTVLLQTATDEPSEDARMVEWARAAWKDIEPFTNGFYSNTASLDDSEQRLQTAYGGNYQRLGLLKRKYDANNLFRLNANVKPA